MTRLALIRRKPNCGESAQRDMKNFPINDLFERLFVGERALKLIERYIGKKTKNGKKKVREQMRKLIKENGD